jgi:WD40 repeat protein
MSCVYDHKYTLLYTGGHDGRLIAWNFETGYRKHSLHENDPTCTSKDYLKDGKSVDQLLILENRKHPKLISMTADQWLRFWNLKDVGDQKPTFKFHCKHPDDDGLTAIATTKDNDYLITGDTSGQMKLWDISEVDLDNQKTENFFLEKWFIIAHRATINTIQIVEEKTIKSGRFIISAS